MQQLDSLLPLYKEWGSERTEIRIRAGGQQFWTIWLHQAVRALCRIRPYGGHTRRIPSHGTEPHLPNLMTQEGVHGNEMMPDARHNTTLPFTRFLCGPADTPCYFSSRVKNTHAHQLALPVVYYSPVTFLFLVRHATTLPGRKRNWNSGNICPARGTTPSPSTDKSGEYVAIARRSGKRWFAGGTERYGPGRSRFPPVSWNKAGLPAHALRGQPLAGHPHESGHREEDHQGGDDIVLKLQASGGSSHGNHTGDRKQRKQLTRKDKNGEATNGKSNGRTTDLFRRNCPQSHAQSVQRTLRRVLEYLPQSTTPDSILSRLLPANRRPFSQCALARHPDRP